MNHQKKYTQSLDRDTLKKTLEVARGDREPDLLIKDVNLLDLVNGEIVQTNIAICGKTIAGVGPDYEGRNVLNAKGLTIVPGFIDAHTHIESSLLHPFEFERLTLPLGTTTAICDPHEITNVMGEEGFLWFLRCSELLTQNLFVQVSSCVPSLPGFEHNGASFDLNQMKKVKNHPHVLGLAEMMNFPGVIQGNDEILDKIEAFEGSVLDGHCPLVRGKLLNAYRVAGIENCHESVSVEEAKEKLRLGMSVILREGSAAKNLATLAPLVSEFNSQQCFLCSDDRNPYEIFHEGHINTMVRRLIQDHGIPAYVAYRLSSFSAAKHFGLKRLGLIAPGYQADFILLRDVNSVQIEEVYIKGIPASLLKLDKMLPHKFEASLPPVQNTVKAPRVHPNDFKLELSQGVYNVIKIIENEIITSHAKIAFDGQHFTENDIQIIAVVERHTGEKRISVGLVQGMGLKQGAIASTIAHDSHNIIVIGADNVSMATAVNALIDSQGGLIVTLGTDVLSHLPLPLAGLMSLESGETISSQLIHLKEAAQKNGVTIQEPFLQMAFLALPVIPHLKITDQGLVNVETLSFIPLKEAA